MSRGEVLPSLGLLGCVLWPMVKGGESWVGRCPRAMGPGTGPGQSECQAGPQSCMVLVMGMREKKVGFILRITGFCTREIKQLLTHLRSGSMSWGPVDQPRSHYLAQVLAAETVAVTLLPLLPPALPDLVSQVCV